MTVLHRTRATLACVCAAGWSLCTAAPIDAADAGSPAAAGAASAAAIDADAAMTSTGHSTIDLLLQLPSHDKAAPSTETTPTLEKGGSIGPKHPLPRPSGAPSSETAAGVPADPPWSAIDTLKSTVNTLGVASPPRAGHLGSDVEAHRRLIEQEHQMRYGAEPPSRPPAVTGSLLDVPMIRFIREHRLAVLAGAVTVLALVWGAANFSFHRRRRR